MTKIEIKHRYTNAVLFSHEAEGNTVAITLKLAIAEGTIMRDADMRGADMRGANMRGADMSGADMSGADMSGADMSDADMRGANMRGANMSGANMSDADMRGADMSGADMSGADMSGADMSGANMRGADMRDANMSGSNLAPIRDDLWAVLSAVPSEVTGLIDALKTGRVDGSTYQGECACLVGTIANVRHVHFEKLGALQPNHLRPIERFFITIRKGDTPATSQFSALAVEWAEQWLDLQRSAFDPKYERHL
jgi:Pentapeptide repeats (8 copies)